MPFNQVELSRETAFKDAVLSQAEAKSMTIIAEAGQSRAAVLEDAYKEVQAAGGDAVQSHMASENDKEFAVVEGQARAELLRHREGLVDELFAKVRQRLAAFTAEAAYPGWLAQRAARHAGEAGGEGLTVLLREEDMPHAAAVQKALPGCEVQPDATLHLGGCRVTNGRVLYDESLDEALAAEREAFYRSGRLRLSFLGRAPGENEGDKA